MTRNTKEAPSNIQILKKAPREKYRPDEINVPENQRRKIEMSPRPLEGNYGYKFFYYH